MGEKENKLLTATVDEAARLLRENPSWGYKEAIDKAKELLNISNGGDKA